MTDTSVKIFTDTMPGAPVISSTAAGQLLPVLDACLVNGFGTVTLDALTVTDGVATAMVSTGHGFAMIGSDPPVGPVISISGATPAALNGEWRISSVPGASSFTFDVGEEITDGSATGTLLAKRAPLGWIKPFSDTNVAVYRNDSIVGTGTYLRIDNTGTDDARPQTYQAMTDVDTGDAGSAQPYWRFYGNTSPSQWCIIGDGRLFYLMINGVSGRWLFNYCAGDLANSAVPTDNINFLLLGYSSANIYQTNQLVYTAGDNNQTHIIAGHANQIDGPQEAFVHAHRAAGDYSGQGLYGFTNLTDSPLLLAQRLIESNDTHRGHLPGLFDPLAYTAGKITDYTTFSIPDDPRTYMHKRLNYWLGDAALVFDITGPWRED